MKDKEIVEKLEDIRDNYKDRVVDRKLLSIVFESLGGAIYTNDEENIAIGYYPKMNIIVFSFFELKNDKLKTLDQRGIPITPSIKAELNKAIKMCETGKRLYMNDKEPTVYHG